MLPIDGFCRPRVNSPPPDLAAAREGPRSAPILRSSSASHGPPAEPTLGIDGDGAEWRCEGSEPGRDDHAGASIVGPQQSQCLAGWLAFLRLFVRNSRGERGPPPRPL